jgi:hypothetical protein
MSFPNRDYYNRDYFVSLGPLSLMLCCCGCVGLVSTHRVKWIENEPLQQPLTVKAMVGDTILLVDGRHLKMLSSTEPLNQQEPVTVIELNQTSAEDEYDVYFKVRSVIRCGNPYDGLIKLPLITDEIPKYTRAYAGKARLESQTK